MKYFELTKDEEKLLKDVESGKFRQVPNMKKEISRYRQYARETLAKSKNINIRISSKDLQRLKARAAEKGIPYQTLVSSVLHQYSGNN